MVEFILALAIILTYAAGCLAYMLYKLLCRFVLWLARPIQEELRHRRVLAEERRKEEQLRALHEESRQAIAQTAAHYVALHEREAVKADCHPGRR